MGGGTGLETQWIQWVGLTCLAGVPGCEGGGGQWDRIGEWKLLGT